MKEIDISVLRVARIYLYDKTSQFLATVVCSKVLASVLRVIAKTLIDIEAKINVISKEVVA